MRGKSGVRVIAVALFLLPVHVVYPHDIWLLPEQFILSKGDVIIVHQLAGSELEVELELPVLRTMTPGFSLITSGGSVDLLSELPDIRTQPEVKPVLQRKVDIEGLALVTMEHAITYTELDNDVFFEYLQHEGLDREEYREHMGSRPVQSEAYARNLKVLVQVGKTTGTELHKQVLGQKIEILLLQNPYRLDPGDDLDVQVLFDGEPLRGQLVKAYNSDGKGPVSKHQTRTNADGIARFKLDRSGLWLIRLVHLFPCSGRSRVDCEDADWESYWSSYSFELD